MENFNQTPGQAQCTFEEIPTIALIDALNSLPFIIKNSFFIPINMTILPPGEGINYLIEWSLREIYEGMSLEDQGQDSKRNATNAVLNARRSLSCLVDWYMHRDGFCYCKNAPRNGEEKANILLKRGIIDRLTSKVLQRIIDIRNEIEHRYKPVSLEKAEDIVELIRRTKDSIFLSADPAQATIIYGDFKHKYGKGVRDQKPMYEFLGWGSEVFINALYESEPWVGVLIPESLFKAEIRRSYLKNSTCDELLLILNILDSKKGYYTEMSGLKYPGPRWSGYMQNDLIELVKLAGLIN